MPRRPRFASCACAGLIAGALSMCSGQAEAQQPYPGAQPYPQAQPAQPYPAQPYPAQPYPAQPYPAQPYPAQPYPAQPYPAQPYPPQGGYPPPAGYPPAGYPPPYQPPPPSDQRSPNEMMFLYVTSALYGIGTGVWIDALAKVKDPGIAVIPPILLGAAAPIGVFAWDSQGGPLHRGVPSSIATGLVLGAVEGIAIAGTQWQYTREKGSDWSFATQTTVTWIMSTGGGIGGWAFGEWIRPDPRSLGFIAGGSAWGAISGTLFGIAVSGKDWKDGASVAGLIGYNAGLVGAGAISIFHTPSWNAQRNMWLGYVVGALAGCLVFPFYLFSDADAKHGFIGPALGGLAGVGVAGAFSWDLKDPEDTQPGHAKQFKPPIDVAISPAPRIDTSSVGMGTGPMMATPQGALLTGYGTF